MSHSLVNRVLVITGASSGIGAAVAIEAARQGMHVVLGARRFRKLMDVRDQATALGVKAIAVRCDVAFDDEVNGLTEIAMNAFGRIDVAFANAGYGFYNSVVDTSDQSARDIFETNFFGTLRLIRAVVPMMRQAGSGHVIINSSAVSEISPPMFGLYSATKAAQDAVACSLRAELASRNIFVTSVHPVGTRTEFFDQAAIASPGKAAIDHMPRSLQQDPAMVASRIVGSMKQNRPAAEIWPCNSVRFGVAIMTAFPTLSAFVMRHMHQNAEVQKTPRPVKVVSTTR